MIQCMIYIINIDRYFLVCYNLLARSLCFSKTHLSSPGQWFLSSLRSDKLQNIVYFKTLFFQNKVFFLSLFLPFPQKNFFFFSFSKAEESSSFLYFSILFHLFQKKRREKLFFSLLNFLFFEKEEGEKEKGRKRKKEGKGRE